MAILDRHLFKELSVLAIAVLSFVAGSLSAGFLRPTDVRADNNRVFELMIYHTKPGRVADLEDIFRDVSKLQAAHNLITVGYWVPNEDPAWKNTFVYLLAHPSMEEAKKNWNALHTDPAFLPYRKAAAPLIEQVNGAYRVDEVYMRPSEYSALK
ncbi:MAG TPA: NIPSNAP family protein [Bryobacteraceae bacterium]|nr:NIPSNAP family protein [Bryobacteraceae bacterium]